MQRWLHSKQVAVCGIHRGRRLPKNTTAAEVEEAIRADVELMLQMSSGGVGGYWGWVEVNGNVFQYRAFVQNATTLRVGTFFRVSARFSNYPR